MNASGPRHARAMQSPVLAVVLAGALLSPQAAAAAPPAPRTLSAQPTPSVHTVPSAPRPRPADLSQGAGAPRTARVGWPAAGAADATVPAGAGRARAGALPAWVAGPAWSGGPAARPGAKPSAEPAAAGPGRVRVQVLDHATLPSRWRDSVLLRIVRADGAAAAGTATLGVDYAGFAGNHGADWASRLRLVSLPACALTTPDAAGCQGTPLPSGNDTAAHQVSATVPVPAAAGGALLAVDAGPAGAAGDYTATPFQPSSAWQAGDNSGNFSWSYPMAAPPALGGPEPSPALAYSSATVDGRSEATNNQPSWVGEGFDYSPGFIERGYATCSDDMTGGNNATRTGDDCWGTDNANLSLGGHAGQLIKDGGSGPWRLRDDDNTKVEHLTGAANGDDNGEHWKITTADGTQYFFGLNRLPGWTGTGPAAGTTQSAWTVPVAGNQAGEPCHAASFTGSFCTQAWRWNLDYVVDPHGSTMSLWYAPETNKYGRNGSTSDLAGYTRGGTLTRVDYGTTNLGGTDSDYTGTAPMQVAFGTDDRCLSGCAAHDAAHWPDTPWDQNCTASPCTWSAPTFWSTRRLTSITTKVLDPATGAQRTVDSWALTQNFPDPGDGTRAGLWLESIVHTGQNSGAGVTGGAVSEPAINFDWTQLPNRVDTDTDHKPAMNWMRLATIWTETGGKISVRYYGQQCTPGSVPTTPQANTTRCFPVLEQQPDNSIKTEYFNRYPVASVTQADLTGGGPDVVTSYEYPRGPAWRHTDDDGITRDKLRTWSDYRGYDQVNARVGDPNSGQQTLTETTYFRGMHGDLNGSGGTRTVTLPAIDGNGDGDTADAADAPAATDENAYTGRPRQTTVYNGVDTQPVSSTVDAPWQSAPTATRDMGDTTVYARHTAVQTTWKGTKLASGWRVTRSDSTFDGYGMQTSTDDQGDLAVSGDETCTRTAYNRNTATNLLDLAGETDVYALRCAATPATDADVISMDRTLYDQHDATTAPTRGDATEADTVKSWTAAGGPVWLAQSTSTVDSYGRVTDSTDVRGTHTLTAYTPATGPVTAVATTGPLGTSTDTVDPARGSTVATVDGNGKRTDRRYDALGRLVGTWLPNRPQATNPTGPSTSYTYLTRGTGGVNAITTRTLSAGDGYVTSYQLFDGLLRARQTQSVSMAPGHAGTAFDDITYDAAGRPASRSQFFDADATPSTTLARILDWQPKTQTLTSYDRAGRETASIQRSAGAELWRATTTYGGDRVNVTPPAGGTATTTISDALGRTVEQRQYHDPADVGGDAAGSYDKVTYHYDRKGRQDVVTDNAGNHWTNSYDLLGRQTGDHDPDKGDNTQTYNDAGDVLTATDGRGQHVAFSYDAIGRRTGEFTPTTAGTKLAAWTYDLPGAKGLPASASRFVGADEYKVAVRGYTPLYHSTGTDYVVPASQTGLAGTYSFTGTEKVDGSPATQTLPDAGGLGAETLTYTYDPATGQPEQLRTNVPGLGQYVSDTEYTAFGELSFVQYGVTGGRWLQRSLGYDDATRRLTDSTTIRQLAPQPVTSSHYGYDPAADVTKDVTTPATGPADTQCFGYDYARRLTDAWTPAGGDCAAARSVAGLGGPAPYWTSWTFDAAGDRRTQTTHAASGDTTATSTYPAAGGAQPHAVTSVVTSGGATRTDAYSYDAFGNTTGRPGPAGPETLTWDTEDKLAKTTDGGQDTTYVYAADGSRLIQSDPTSTTLYLPGMEVARNKASGAVTATRFYQWAGQPCAQISTGAGLTWLVADEHGTQQVSVNAGTQAITSRLQAPYGGPRGTDPTWPNPKGFVGGDRDTDTGLTHLGARDYDPALGRFLSPDPQFDQSDPQSWQNYGYADNAPTTGSDPTGTRNEYQYYGPSGGDNSPAPCTGGEHSGGCVGQTTPTTGHHSKGGTSHGCSDGEHSGCPSRKPARRSAGKPAPRCTGGEHSGGCIKDLHGHTPPKRSPVPYGHDTPDPIAGCQYAESCVAAVTAPTKIKKGIIPPKGTDGYCIGAGFSAVVTQSWDFCVVADNNGVAIERTHSVGLGAFPSAGVHFDRQKSDAQRARDLAGPFAYGGGNVGPVDGSYSWGPSDDGPVHVYQYGVSGGPSSADVSGSGGTSTTKVSGYLPGSSWWGWWI
ncbi:MAG: hypothetical protein V7637_2636 [Mycobacteriales bacterium]